MTTVLRGGDNFDTSIGSNVVQTHVTATSSQSLSGGTRADITNLTANITPKSTSSKIMVEVRWAGEFSHVAPHDSVFGIRRGGVDVGNPSSSGSRAVGITTVSIGYPADSSTTPEVCHYSYLDSPATTGTTTYTASVLSNAASTLYNNRTVADPDAGHGERLTSSITLTEVQG